MERIEVERMKRSEGLFGGWAQSVCRIPTVVIAAISLLVSLPSLAATSLDFVTSDGQFSIANGELTFTNDFTIPVATVGGISDGSLIDARLELDPIPLSADDITQLGGGVVQIGVPAESLTLSIREPITEGGALLATATLVPGDLFVFSGTSGELSSEVASGLTDFVLEPAGGASSVLSSFAATADPIAIELVLSAAGQDIAALFEAGSPVTGSASGSMAIAVPEPSAALLTGAATATLLLVTGLRRRGRPTEARSDS